MSASKRIRVALLYGGRSGEHEVSLQSAASVLRHLDRERFEVIPIGIDKEGRWRVNDVRLIEERLGRELPIPAGAPQVVLAPDALGGAALLPLRGEVAAPEIDVFFPLVHGTTGEDGALQGLLELAGVAYVGAGVLASSTGMDKDVAKRLACAAGVPVVPYLVLRRRRPGASGAALVREIDDCFGFPVFVKPANLGSSVGVTRVGDAEDLEGALACAFEYDDKVLVEKAVHAREIEVAVLESATAGAPPIVSVPGEVAPRAAHEFYSYQAKYLDENGAALEVPARLTQAEAARAQTLAAQVFQALECEGMARVDLFLERDGGSFYFNEVNTIPGFTSISMYPRLLEASGISYRELLTHLIELARARQLRRRRLRRDYRPAEEPR